MAPDHVFLKQNARMNLDDDSEDVLSLAEKAGGLGIFEWHVQADTVRLSPRFLALYGLPNFDGRNQSWLASVFQEDQLRVGNVLDTALADKEREIQFDFRIVRATDKALRWMEARALIFYDAEQRPVPRRWR